jgi:Na+/H+-dicarboxylate symporter
MKKSILQTCARPALLPAPLLSLMSSVPAIARTTRSVPINNLTDLLIAFIDRSNYLSWTAVFLGIVLTIRACIEKADRKKGSTKNLVAGIILTTLGLAIPFITFLLLGPSHNYCVFL